MMRSSGNIVHEVYELLNLQIIPILFWTLTQMFILSSLVELLSSEPVDILRTSGQRYTFFTPSCPTIATSKMSLT